jgi:hypothetical protein
MFTGCERSEFRTRDVYMLQSIKTNGYVGRMVKRKAWNREKNLLDVHISELLYQKIGITKEVVWKSHTQCIITMIFTYSSTPITHESWYFTSPTYAPVALIDHAKVYASPQEKCISFHFFLPRDDLLTMFSVVYSGTSHPLSTSTL